MPKPRTLIPRNMAHKLLIILWSYISETMLIIWYIWGEWLWGIWRPMFQKLKNNSVFWLTTYTCICYCWGLIRNYLIQSIAMSVTFVMWIRLDTNTNVGLIMSGLLWISRNRVQEENRNSSFVSAIGYFYATQHLRSQVGEKYTAEEVMDNDNHGWGTKYWWTSHS